MPASIHQRDHEIVLREPESVLRAQLEEPELEVSGFECGSLVKAGDNYGSTILRVRLEVRRRDGSREELQLVAKMLPPSDHTREMFQSDFTFKKEIFVYEQLIPAYRRIYGEEFEIAPRFFGARLSRQPGKDEIDEDALIFMENLKVKGYYMGERFKGLDIEHLQIAIPSLAKFHAIGLSLKHREPSFLPKVEYFAKPMLIVQDTMKPYVDAMLNAVKNDPFLRPYYPRIEAAGDPNDMDSIRLRLEATEPWACVVHNDFWINNALFHRNEAGRVDDVKIVDFQTYHMSSPLTDLVFFLSTSLSSDLPGDVFDEMLELYRLSALEVCRKIGFGEELFDAEAFEGRLRIDAPAVLYHIVIMCKVVELRDGEEIEDSGVNEFCMRRIRNVVRIFLDKGWI